MSADSLHTIHGLQNILAVRPASFVRRRNLGYASSQELTVGSRQKYFSLSKGGMQ